jgi:hypothetical protein
MHNHSRASKSPSLSLSLSLSRESIRCDPVRVCVFGWVCVATLTFFFVVATVAAALSTQSLPPVYQLPCRGFGVWANVPCG